MWLGLSEEIDKIFLGLNNTGYGLSPDFINKLGNKKASWLNKVVLNFVDTRKCELSRNFLFKEKNVNIFLNFNLAVGYQLKKSHPKLSKTIPWHYILEIDFYTME